jgi:cation diffusion facilitator family transporter
MDVMEWEKRRAAGVSVAFNIVSTIIKLIAAVLTGSVSLLSEAAHSLTDVFASSIALISVTAAAAPPDEEHPFGHGKIESLAGFGESILLFGVVVYVVVEAVMRLVTPQPIVQLDLGLWVMAASSVGALGVARYVGRIGYRTHSLALKSNAQHLMVDFVTSVGVLVGLLAVHLTGVTWSDSVVALGLAVWMTVGAWRLARQAFHDLIDIRLPDEEVARIGALVEHEPGVLGYHRLRTRRAGSLRYVDMHIVVPREWSLLEAHDLADRLEKRIETELAPANVVIHVDPYDPNR